MNMQHVVHVTTVPDSLVFLEGQAAYMRERGFTLSVVSSPGERLDTFARREQVEAHAVSMPRAITPLLDARAVADLARMLRRLRPDIVHAHTPKGGLIGTLAAAAARVPVRIYHMRGLPLLTQHGWKRALLTQTERMSCAAAHRVIAVSHSLRDEALSRRLCTASRITVLGAGSGQGVDVDRFRPASGAERRAARHELGLPDDAVVFAFVGRMAIDKGIAELGRAWQALRERHAGAYLMLVGGQDARDGVPPEMLAAIERDPGVRAVGFATDTRARYAAADVVVLPTYREGFPNVPLEAASMALPVVATRSVGCVDAVQDGITGLLVPVRSSDALADAMSRYAHDAALRARHGLRGRERVLREFRRERVWYELACEYERLLGRHTVARAPIDEVRA